MLKGLRTVIYHVSDLAAAKKWYTAATGIDPYFDEPFYVGFDINGFELGLDPSMDQVADGNHSKTYWAVESVAAALKKFQDLGAELVQDLTNVGGTVQVAVVADPFGNHIGFIEGA